MPHLSNWAAGQRADAGRTDAHAHFVHMPVSPAGRSAVVVVLVSVGPELNLGDIPC